MKYGDCTFREIQEAADANWIVILPTGCTEQQGLHLPIDFDTWLAGELAEAISTSATRLNATNSLVLPAMSFGPTPEHRGFGAGYIDVPQRLHEELVVAVLQSLADQGFARILIWLGCGQHRLAQAAAKFTAELGSKINVFIPELPYQGVWEMLVGPNLPGGHADAFATSLALARHPTSVRTDEISFGDFTIPDWSDPHLDLSRHSTAGSIGDPTAASAELGVQLWEALVAAGTKILVDYDLRTR